MSGPDVLVVSVASTAGWRRAARELTEALLRTGVSAELLEATGFPRVRTFALTDLVQARAARATAAQRLSRGAPRAVIYCAITSALLWPRPGAIWLDAVAAENRPGRDGVWQRRVERRRLAAAPLVMEMAPGSLEGLRRPWPDTVVVPVPVEPSGPGPGPAHRPLAALVYAADPDKRRLDVVLEAWHRARRGGEELHVAGLDELPPGAPRAGVRAVGRLPPDQYRALVRSARVFLAAPRREDYGIAPLEALADGCRLVTTPSPGAYPAMRIARRLDPRLVSEDLSGALRTALDDPQPGYAERAARELAPFRRAAVDRVLTETVLPRLLGP